MTAPELAELLVESIRARQQQAVTIAALIDIVADLTIENTRLHHAGTNAIAQRIQSDIALCRSRTRISGLLEASRERRAA